MTNSDSNQFKVNLNTFSGPLDILLDLAKSQKVNLENISITKLADQFHEFITKAKNLNLEFLGFSNQHIKSKFSKMFPEDKKNISLENWDKFENSNPNTFYNMYQFWVRKT